MLSLHSALGVFKNNYFLNVYSDMLGHRLFVLTVANLWMRFKDVRRVELENIRVWADLTSDLLIDSANLMDTEKKLYIH